MSDALSHSELPDGVSPSGGRRSVRVTAYISMPFSLRVQVARACVCVCVYAAYFDLSQKKTSLIVRAYHYWGKKTTLETLPVSQHNLHTRSRRDPSWDYRGGSGAKQNMHRQTFFCFGIVRKAQGTKRGHLRTSKRYRSSSELGAQSHPAPPWRWWVL